MQRNTRTPAGLGLPAAGQTWAVFADRRGLVRSFLRSLPQATGGEPPLRTSVVSLETQQAFYERELRRDDTNFLDHLDPGTSGLDILLESGADEERSRAQARRVGLEDLLERGYRLLSTGESRLLLLLREVLAEPQLLVTTSLVEGLDERFRHAAAELLSDVASRGGRVVAFVDRPQDIPVCATHLCLLRAGAEAVLLTWQPRGPGPIPEEIHHLLSLARRPAPELPAPSTTALPCPDPLLRMRGCAVRYGAGASEVTQFEGLSWELRRGEHTLVVGPNGAGKSTLLSMISGDHPQCYGNDLWLFGYQRGSGESVWDIKRNIGLVSPGLHRDYRVKASAASVIASGLYDSIGVYRQVPPEDRRLADRWLDVVGLPGAGAQRFDSLSWAQQRLVLIARGLIKHPPLLILDEPTQGLDEVGRQLVLAFLQQLDRLQRTTMLMVTHRRDEQLPLFRRRLTFRACDKPGVRFEIVVG